MNLVIEKANMGVQSITAVWYCLELGIRVSSSVIAILPFNLFNGTQSFPAE